MDISIFWYKREHYQNNQYFKDENMSDYEEDKELDPIDTDPIEGLDDDLDEFGAVHKDPIDGIFDDEDFKLDGGEDEDY